MKKKFSWRAFISIGLFYTFFILLLTGMVLYVAPAGRIANWVNWKLVGLTKAQWQSIHTIFALLFVILSIFHLFSINWKAFWTYLKSKTKQGLNKKREFYLSTIFTVLIFIGVIFSIPPLRYVMDLSESLTESWENDESEPPIPHAELLTLQELSEQLNNISLDSLQSILKANKISFNGLDETLSDIGIANQISPDKIYDLITASRNTKSPGGGFGRKTLEDISVEINKDLDQVLKILEDNNIKASKKQTLRDIASENNMAPVDIYDLIK